MEALDLGVASNLAPHILSVVGHESYSGDDDDLALPILSTVDPYANTEMRADRMAALLEDISRVVSTAKAGPELRGLLRLQVMAEACAKTRARLAWIGD